MRGALGLGLGMLAEARARAALLSQQRAQYQPRPQGGMSCAIYSFFRPPASCKVVAGNVSPMGWCKFFDISD